eukprot:TRINITY_DN62343_c0_g1_i1.p1 TRINITY_DN62343_c0_g1~~TRINITY_DN62343_c0_g1_i1.p1  ORF type:complete len:643 (-),score=101.18 TRINITY_DN62343_c0_g1_i1:48-1976(-)
MKLGLWVLTAVWTDCCWLVADGSAATVSWVFDADDAAAVPQKALRSGSGYTLIGIGSERGVLITPDGHRYPVRRGDVSTSDASDVPPPVIQAAMKAAAELRAAATGSSASGSSGSRGAACPDDADDHACSAWCHAIAPLDVEYHGRSQGSRCSELPSTAERGPTCACGPVDETSRGEPWAWCVSRCPKQAAQPSAAAAKIKPSPSKDATSAAAGSAGSAKAEAQNKPSPNKEITSEATRYLLYDTSFGKTFAEQLQVFWAMLDIVKELNAAIKRRCASSGKSSGSNLSCQSWTLVLPPWCSVVHWYSDTAGKPWGDLFDMDHLASVDKDIVIKDFKDVRSKLTSLDLTAVVPSLSQRGSGSGGNGLFSGWARALEECEQGSSGQQQLPQILPKSGRSYNEKYGGGKRGGHVVYSGYCDGDILASEVRCGHLQRVSRDAIIDMLGSLRTEPAVLLKNLDGIGLDGLVNMEESAVRFKGALKPAKQLQEVVKRFSRRTLGSNRYVSVHLRRNDFEKHYPEYTPSARAAANRINQVLKKQKLDQVFVATDARLVYQDELRRLVKAPLYYLTPEDGAPQLDYKGQEEVLNMQILANGATFIGTSECVFSAAVRREREHVLGLRQKDSEAFCANLSETAEPKRCRLS